MSRRPKRVKAGRRPAGTPRRSTLVASAMFIGVLIVATSFVLLSQPSEGPGQAEQATSSAPAPSPTATDSRKGTDCSVTDKTQKVPTEAPTDVEWKLWHGGAMPTSTSAGPQLVDDDSGYTACYAHTPVGASLAAMNIAFRMSLAAPDTTVVDRQVATGRNKDALRRSMSEYDPPESSIPQIAGFRINNYSRSQALIDIAVGDESAYAHSQKLVTWQDGTWRMVATTDDLDTEREWQGLDSLNGYIEFRGVG